MINLNRNDILNLLNESASFREKAADIIFSSGIDHEREIDNIIMRWQPKGEKISAIKDVRAYAQANGLADKYYGLKEAKDRVDSKWY